MSWQGVISIFSLLASFHVDLWPFVCGKERGVERKRHITLTPCMLFHFSPSDCDPLWFELIICNVMKSWSWIMYFFVLQKACSTLLLNPLSLLKMQAACLHLEIPRHFSFFHFFFLEQKKEENVSWEPEGCYMYHYSKMFRWEPEERYFP